MSAVDPGDFILILEYPDHTLRLARYGCRWIGWAIRPEADSAQLVIRVTDDDIRDMGRDPWEYAASMIDCGKPP